MRKMHVLWAASTAVLRRWLTNLNAFIREEDTLQYRCLFFKKLKINLAYSVPPGTPKDCNSPYHKDTWKSVIISSSVGYRTSRGIQHERIRRKHGIYARWHCNMMLCHLQENRSYQVHLASLRKAGTCGG